MIVIPVSLGLSAFGSPSSSTLIKAQGDYAEMPLACEREPGLARCAAVSVSSCFRFCARVIARWLGL